MDEKGDAAMVMGDDEPKASKGEKEVADCSAKNVSFAEKTANIGTDKDIRKYADEPKERVSIKAKLEAMKVKAFGKDMEKQDIKKEKSKEVIL